MADAVIAQIVSANDWLRKAGAFIDENDNLHLPMLHISVSMTAASRCIEQYNEALLLHEKIPLVQSIAVSVRSADTSYFQRWSEIVIENNRHTWRKLFECFNCFTKTFSANSLREQVAPQLRDLRELANTENVHVLEGAVTIKLEQLRVAFDYYDCFLELNLMHYPAIDTLEKKKCKTCEKKSVAKT